MQLSQLLLVYIGTAADIIEFFDSFKDERVNTDKVLCVMILSIWSWSLLQFTFVLTATKGRKTRITQEESKVKTLHKAKEICCSLDVWGILINIILQDAPFFVFRVLLIAYYKLISYMNIFFTCKNTLVITLQFYRLLVVQLEKKEALKKEEADAKKKLLRQQRGGAGASRRGDGMNMLMAPPPKKKKKRKKEGGGSGSGSGGGDRKRGGGGGGGGGGGRDGSSSSYSGKEKKRRGEGGGGGASDARLF